MTVQRIDVLSYPDQAPTFPDGFFDGPFQVVAQFKPGKDQANNYATSIHAAHFSKLLHDLGGSIQPESKEGSLRLHFADELENFDLGIMGALAMFGRHFPHLKILLRLPPTSRYSNYARFYDSLSKVRSIYRNLTGITLFAFDNEKRMAGEPQDDPLLIFPVNPDSFHNYFVDSRSSWEIRRLFEPISADELDRYQWPEVKGSIAEQNYHRMRLLLRAFDHQLAWKHNQRSFLQEYIKLLSSFNLLRESIDPVSPSLAKKIAPADFLRRNFSELEMNTLREEVRPIIGELLEEPSFHIYLFCFLANQNIGTAVIRDVLDDQQRVKTSKVKVLVHRLKELAEFTKNLFQGLREIARNIVDHTDSRSGIITGRIYAKGILSAIKHPAAGTQPGPISFYEHRLAEKKDWYGDQDYFELAIQDEGQDGIVRKTIANIEKLAREDQALPDAYQGDIQRLTTGEIALPDFFNTREIKLYHHAIRTASHWGLITFSNLIDKNDGFFFVSSRSYLHPGLAESCYACFGDVSAAALTTAELAEQGTHYQVILPLNRDQGLYAEITEPAGPASISFSASNYHKLFKYRLLSERAALRPNQPDVLFRLPVARLITPEESNLYRNELSIAKKISEHILAALAIQPLAIPVLDFDGCDSDFDQSRLLRFLAFLQLKHNCRNLIITNIRANNILALRDLIRLGAEKFPDAMFWNASHFVLIYSYDVDLAGRRTYFTDILGGYNHRDLMKLCANLSVTHQSLFRIKGDVDAGFSQQSLGGMLTSPLFKADVVGIVQNFELLLQYQGTSYFELSLENTLNKDVYQTEPDKIGYKISDTHFRLGSKIHITEFIYAKRLFQKSFYSDRFAFLVVRYLAGAFADLKGQPVTLLGYGEYAQLLINRSTEILKLIWPEAVLNNDIVSDVSEVKLLKNTMLLENVVIIVPINTTFSTAIKIENWVREQHKEVKQVIPINLILVSHQDLKDSAYTDGLNAYLAGGERSPEKERLYPYRQFNWTYVDAAKLVATVDTNPSSARTTFQKYFIPIHSNWSHPDDCIKCFPGLDPLLPEAFSDYRILEEPLLETDKVSVTPDLLLDIPKSFKIAEGQLLTCTDPDVFFNEAAYRGGHIHFRKGHYLNFIEPANFFTHYPEQIARWAQACREQLLAMDPELLHKPVLLISSSNNINAYFIEYINRVVFDDAAIINHYEIGEDYIENFHKFFSGDIRQSEYVFFVDDVIHSGNTFHLINDFVRYCHINLPKAVGKGSCNGVFTLINKTDHYAQNDIAGLLSNPGDGPANFFAFYQWKDYYIPKEKCPICKEKERYETLAGTSMLDTVRHLFYNKAHQLHLVNFEDNHSIDSGWTRFHPLVLEKSVLPWMPGGSARCSELWATFEKGYFPGKGYLKMLIAHALNELFSEEDDILLLVTNSPGDLRQPEGVERYRDLLGLIIGRMLAKKPFASWLSVYNPVTAQLFRQIFRELVLKVLTQHPFRNIKPIRERVFSWILIDLSENLKRFTAEGRLPFRDFRYLKFLLSRITALGSNFIIDERTLSDFRIIFNKYRESSWEEITEERNERLKNLDDEYESMFRRASELGDEIKLLKLRVGELNGFAGLEVDLAQLADQVIMRERAKRQQERDQLLRQINDHEEEILLLAPRIRYVLQARNNIVYKDISLKEFSYFYVSLVKELTLNNESKILTLEKNVNKLFDVIDREQEKDFYYLLRLIKLENVSLLRSGTELIMREFAPTVWEISLDQHCYMIRDKIIQMLTTALNDYRLAAFKQFLGITDVEQWLQTDTGNQIIHLVYLMESLKREGKRPVKPETLSPDQISATLESKADSILRNLYRIVCDPDFDKRTYGSPDSNPFIDEETGHGAFLTLRYRGYHRKFIKPQDLTITNGYFSGEQNPEEKDRFRSLKGKLTETDIDTESLSYLVLNGLSGVSKLKSLPSEKKLPIEFLRQHPPLKPWTILELSTDDALRAADKWQVDRGIIHNAGAGPLPPADFFTMDAAREHSLVDYFFNEFTVIEEPSDHLVFFRIADLGIRDKEVFNDGKAVVAFFTKGYRITIERLRLLLLLSQSLNRFFKSHYEQDSLIAFIEERQRLTEATRLKHGFDGFLKELHRAANKQDMNGRDLIIDVCFNQLNTGPQLAAALLKARLLDHDGVRKYINTIFKPEPFNADKLETLLKNIADAVYKGKIVGSMDNTFQVKPVLQLSDGDFFNWSIKILKIMVTELFVNAKKSHDLIVQPAGKILKISLSFADGFLILSVENNYTNPIQPGEKRRIEKGNFRYSTHGLGLVYRICDIFGSEKPVIQINEDTQMFLITIKLKSQ